MNRKAYDLFRLIVQDTTNLFVVSKIIVKTPIIVFLLFFGVSIAQGATVSLQTSTVIEAENMTVTGATNRATPDGWELLGEAKLAMDVEFKDGKVDLDIIAKGDFAGGAWPKMEVKIAGTVISTIDVDSATWKSFLIEGVNTTLGTHELSVAFINDFYEGTPETDRNFYMDKVTITEIIEIIHPGTVTVAWDANTEENLQGYKIYYGRVSRFETVGLIQAWCVAHEPKNEKCADEWEEICKDRPACHPMLFKYEKVIDVKNVTEYKINNLIPGVTYYLAATAYADPKVPNQESFFSIELTHFVGVEAPAEPEKLILKIPELQLSDSIKEIEEE